MSNQKQLFVSINIDYDECTLNERRQYVRECINAGELIYNDINMKFKQYIDNSEYHVVFEYNAGNLKKYYTLNTCDPKIYQACSYKPYESLGFLSDENGYPLCENNDPFNCGEINNCGRDLNETHYASFFDLNYIIKYPQIEDE